MQFFQDINLPNNLKEFINKGINSFKDNYRNTFVDNFFFILLHITQCNFCYNIKDIKSYITYFIGLSAPLNNSISNLIQQYMYSQKYISNSYCPFCNNNSQNIELNTFLYTPKYLLIDFEGLPKNQKQLENEIDLTYCIKTNKGPRTYHLYALICKDFNEGFVAYIKFNGSWFYHYDENKCKECSYESINQYYPYFAIYEGNQI